MALLLTTMGSALAVDRFTLSPSTLEPDGAPVSAAKSRSGELAQTDPALLGRNDTTPVPVFIKLDYDAVASYAGDVEGLAATSPEVTGLALDENTAAVGTYLDFVAAQEAVARTAIEAAVPQSTVIDSYRVVYGGLSAVVPANRVGALLAVPGVAAVQEDKLERPQTDATPDFIGATAAWPQLGGSTIAGEGVIVGVLDTGIWPEHPSLADNGIDHPGGTFACEFGNGSDPLGDAFTCNDKLIGAHAFVDTYMAVIGAIDGEFCNNTTGECSARDANGHGTHTASTAAGSRVDQVNLLGTDRGPISGIAPGAHVIAYRVCLDQGCFQSDMVAAVEQAITDGVDVINFSISGGASAYTDAVELAFLGAYEAGILVNASSGNSGPDAGTADHAGPWTNTVGASTSNRHFLTTLSLTAAGADVDLTGATVTDGVATPADVILAQDVPGYDDPFCGTDLPVDSASGMVVACQRGVIARVDKSKHVQPSGAAGMILYNFDPANGTGLNTDNHFIPSVHIDVEAGHALIDHLAANADAKASWGDGVATAVRGDVMAGFSSRGPLGDFLKPDATAPGVQILAGNSPQPVGEATGVPGQFFQAIQGTSMSSPHAAGVAALVKAAHPDWTPGQIKSALMTSSIQAVLKEDGVTPADPFDRGAGSIRANRAITPSVTFDVGADDYFASAADPLGRLHLNLASVYANPMAGAVVTERTMTNVSGVRQDVSISVQSPVGASISVTPRSFRLQRGASQEIRITIDATDLVDGWYFGQINVEVKGRAIDAVLPVAFNKTQGTVTLDHTCDAATITRGTAADCSVTVRNLSPAQAQVSLDVRTSTLASRLEITNIGAPGVRSGNGFTWSGTLSPVPAPTIDALVEAPGGYVPLADFGVPPISGLGDESIVNFNVPAFQFGSETYTRVGFTSNGYAVVGGGDVDDVEFVPQALPDPARPNNVLAPFWTDLNFATGGELRVARLCSGPNSAPPCWIVADFAAVPTFESEGAVTDTFEIWIMDGADESISFAYGPIGGADGIGLTIGAENRDGSSGKTVGAPPATAGNDWYVITSPSAPGGTLTIPYDALGKRNGTYDIVASMTTDVLNSVTRESVRITVR